MGVFHLKESNSGIHPVYNPTKPPEMRTKKHVAKGILLDLVAVAVGLSSAAVVLTVWVRHFCH